MERGNEFVSVELQSVDLIGMVEPAYSAGWGGPKAGTGRALAAVIIIRAPCQHIRVLFGISCARRAVGDRLPLQGRVPVAGWVPRRCGDRLFGLGFMSSGLLLMIVKNYR